jgi:uncharacterized lipoprotein YddW (UPF0748 family)
MNLQPLLAAAFSFLVACSSGSEVAARESGQDSRETPPPSSQVEIASPKHAPEHPAAIKAVWVTRFDYKTEADLEAIFSNCATAGFNTVMFQVRGNATAFYDSPLEPWSEQLGGKSPGFDPLERAVALAREYGISLHAWINLMTAWWGTTPPTDPAQVVNAHPEWLWVDQYGKRQELSDKFYVSLNPCLPEVRTYLRDVVADLATRYDVEGIHLDYARFPSEPPATPAGTDVDYPRDARTRELFRAATGYELTRSKLAPAVQAAWNTWRTEAVTQTIQGIRAGLQGLESPPVLSVAVKAEPDAGIVYFQDALGWVRTGLVDAVFPMNYVQDVDTFDRRNASWLAALGQLEAEAHTVPHFVIGVRAAAKDHAKTRVLIQHALAAGDGFCLFAYSNLFDSTNVDIDTQDEAASAERAKRRAALLPFIAES